MSEPHAATPVRPGAAPTTPVMRSTAHWLHAAEGATFAIEAGWEIPAAYRSVHEDLFLDAVGVCDITARGKVDVRGAVDKVLTGLGNGAVPARISDAWALVLTPPGEAAAMVGELEPRAGASGMVTDATHLYAGFALAGPKLPEVLARVTGFDASTVARGSSAGAPMAGIRSVLVRRDLPGELIEVYVGFEFGRYAWETFAHEVRSIGGGPVGWDALRAWGWTA